MTEILLTETLSLNQSINYILSVNEKLPVSIFQKIYNTALWLLLRSCFWSTTSWFGEIKQLHEPWSYGAHAFYYVFLSF